ncbi:unnamed protein product [Orchesella dallaii]|uniref:GH18 domain-containing protein n=1 Tax=Orchesella dallaii TaxID=48710 RepID=A0ABP1QNE5_9HEXA
MFSGTGNGTQLWIWILITTVMFNLSLSYDPSIVPTEVSLDFSGDENLASVLAHEKVVVCYVGTWAAYRKLDGKYDITNIDPKLCTHIIYSFAGLDNQTYEMKPLDPWLDLYVEKNGGGNDWYNKFTQLKQKNHHLKVLLAIGGWNEGSIKYSEMAADPAKRQKFIASAVKMIKEHGFDGLDLDWEFPGSRGGKPEDKHTFTKLVEELRVPFDRHGLILTAALGPAKSTAEQGYEVKPLARLLDQIHLMCYDYHGSWDKKTSHNAPLYASFGEGSIEASVEYYLQKGVPARKLVMGLPTYGRTFLLSDGTEDGPALGKAAGEVGFSGPYTNEPGFLGYNEIVKELLSNRGDWQTFWDDNAKVPFMRNGNKWLTFDNPESIREKVEFAIKKNLRGAMFWSIETDDFLGLSGVKYPLLKTVNFVLSQDTSTNEIPTDEPPTKPSSATSLLKMDTVFMAIASLITVILKSVLYQ